MIGRYVKPVLVTLLFGWLGFLVAFQIDSGTSRGSSASRLIVERIYDLTEMIGPVPTGIMIAALGPIAGYYLWRKAMRADEG